MMKYTLAAIGLTSLAACGGAEPSDAPKPPAKAIDAPADATTDNTALNTAVNGSWRTDEDRARDAWRHPAETLAFFDVQPDDTVLEIWPGRGWYTSILAPYLHAGGGKLVAVVWDIEAMPEDRRSRYEAAITKFTNFYASDADTYGSIELAALSETSGPLGAPESADVVLTFRNVHNWMANGYETKVFEDAFAVLKPGGILGVVEHRLPSSDVQDPEAKSGYVHEDYVKALATNAGFEFDSASDINANPADDADHPYGVWTLPPVSRTADQDGNTPEDFDASAYSSIGESDRMTLKFVKPVAGDAE